MTPNYLIHKLSLDFSLTDCHLLTRVKTSIDLIISNHNHQLGFQMTEIDKEIEMSEIDQNGNFN